MSTWELRELPDGDRGWAEFVEALTHVDDRAERHYLELKSTADLHQKKDQAKVVKFILGARNRMPDVAAEAFAGKALMVLGVTTGAAPGIPAVENLIIERAVVPFIGAGGPRWDIVRVPIARERDVVIVIVAAPKWGEGAYPCLLDGDGLTNGAVYVRGDGETRVATGPDILQLNRRAAQTDMDVDIWVTASDVQHKMWDRGIGDEFVDAVRAALMKALPPGRGLQPMTGSTDPFDIVSSALNRASAAGAAASVMPGMEIPESRTQAEFLDEVDQWDRQIRSSWTRVIDPCIASTAPTKFAVVNRSDRFLVDLEVKLHLEGDVDSLNWTRRAEVGRLLPRPPRPWGPVPRDLGVFAPNVTAGALMGRDATAAALQAARSPKAPGMTFRNSGSIDAELTIPELRPRLTVELPNEMVIVVRDPALTEIRGTWTATARDVHRSMTDELTIPIVPAAQDITAKVAEALRTLTPH